MNTNESVEDGMGFSGLVPSLAEKNQEREQDRQQQELETLRRRVAELEFYLQHKDELDFIGEKARKRITDLETIYRGLV